MKRTEAIRVEAEMGGLRVERFGRRGSGGGWWRRL